MYWVFMYNSHINIQFDDLLSDVKSQIIIIIIIIIIGYAKLDLLTNEIPESLDKWIFFFLFVFPCVCVCVWYEKFVRKRKISECCKQTNKQKVFHCNGKTNGPCEIKWKRKKIFFFPSSSLNYANKTLPKQKMFSPLFFND